MDPNQRMTASEALNHPFILLSKRSETHCAPVGTTFGTREHSGRENDYNAATVQSIRNESVSKASLNAQYDVLIKRTTDVSDKVKSAQGSNKRYTFV